MGVFTWKQADWPNQDAEFANEQALAEVGNEDAEFACEQALAELDKGDGCRADWHAWAEDVRVWNRMYPDHYQSTFQHRLERDIEKCKKMQIMRAAANEAIESLGVRNANSMGILRFHEDRRREIRVEQAESRRFALMLEELGFVKVKISINLKKY